MQAQIFEHNTWIEEIDPDVIRHQMQSLLNQSQFNIVDFIEHHFEGQGYTAVWLLGESHLAIHTFPEEGKTYLQMSSCSPYKLKIFRDSLMENQTTFEHTTPYN